MFLRTMLFCAAVTGCSLVLPDPDRHIGAGTDAALDSASIDVGVDGEMDANNVDAADVDANHLDAGDAASPDAAPDAASPDAASPDASPDAGCAMAGMPCEMACGRGTWACMGDVPQCAITEFLAASEQCRAATGDCDSAEFCTGTTAECPADGVQRAGVVCRAADGDCDAAEVCNGSSAQCPADAFASGTTCRASSGDCDRAETCNGTSAACPANGFLSGTVCRAAATSCDAVEVCSGSSATCPANAFTSGNICRPAANTCDQAETCGGASAVCPTDLFATPGTPCSGGQCNGAGMCTTGTTFCSGVTADFCSSFEASETRPAIQQGSGGSGAYNGDFFTSGSIGYRATISTAGGEAFFDRAGQSYLTGDLWVRAMLYVPGSTSLVSNEIGLIGIDPNTGNNGLNFNMNDANGFSLFDDFAGVEITSAALTRDPTTRWECFELHIVVSPTTSGSVEIYRNGTLAASRGTIRTRDSNPLTTISAGVTFTNGTQAVPFTVAVDDFAFGTTRIPCSL